MNKSKLEEYLVKGYTLKQMASDSICSQSNIRNWLKKYNLKLLREARGKHPKDYSTPRQCSCGETDPDKFYGHKVSMCGKCHNKVNLEAGRKKREFVLEQLGGKCKACGYNKFACALDVHHLKPEHKDPNFASSRGWSKERLLTEIVGCILLCKCCHAAIHNGDFQID